MKTLAAILVETGKPLIVDEIEIPSLKTGQVLIEIAFSGVCHTQILECGGFRGEDRFLPHCLGHEGSGIVRDIGSGVEKVKAGDRVILSWIKGSGADIPGTFYRWGVRVVNAGGITTFSRYSIISENRLTIIHKEISMQEAAMLGCAVPTGAGMLFNTAMPAPSQNIAVFGTGGIGLCAVAAALIAGCKKIIAVDIHDNKLIIAKQMGATHCVNAANINPVKEINNICPGGVDFSIEASGQPEVMLQALYSVRSQGGTAIIAGNAQKGKKIELDPDQLNQGKRLLGTWGGDNRPDRDYPRYCELIASGKLNLKPIFSKPYSLNKINTAIEDLKTSKVVRPLIDMSLA